MAHIAVQGALEGKAVDWNGESQRRSVPAALTLLSVSVISYRPLQKQAFPS
jgi:hypothetical protein